MDAEFAAKALVGGHHDIVRVVISDIEDKADRAFYVLKVTAYLTRLYEGDRKKANKVMRGLR